MHDIDNLPSDRLALIVRQAEERSVARTLENVCQMVGVGVRSVQSRERTADTARRRGVVVWILCDRLNWTHRKVARLVGRTERQVERILRKERVMSGNMPT